MFPPMQIIFLIGLKKYLLRSPNMNILKEGGGVREKTKFQNSTLEKLKITGGGQIFHKVLKTT